MACGGKDAQTRLVRLSKRSGIELGNGKRNRWAAGSAGCKHSTPPVDSSIPPVVLCALASLVTAGLACGHQYVRQRTRIHSGIGKDKLAGQEFPSVMRPAPIVFLELKQRRREQKLGKATSEGLREQGNPTSRHRSGRIGSKQTSPVRSAVLALVPRRGEKPLLALLGQEVLEVLGLGCKCSARPACQDCATGTSDRPHLKFTGDVGDRT